MPCSPHAGVEPNVLDSMEPRWPRAEEYELNAHPAKPSIVRRTSCPYPTPPGSTAPFPVRIAGSAESILWRLPRRRGRDRGTDDRGRSQSVICALRPGSENFLLKRSPRYDHYGPASSRTGRESSALPAQKIKIYTGVDFHHPVKTEGLSHFFHCPFPEQPAFGIVK